MTNGPFLLELSMDKPLDDMEQWMVKMSLACVKAEGLDPVLERLRAQGYDRVASAVDERVKAGMTPDQIKARVEAGGRVFWMDRGYEVIKDSIGQWHIKCHQNGNCIGLTWADGVTLNGAGFEFFTV